MRIEEHFKHTLERAIANEPPVIDSWARFERRVRRDRGVRIFGSTAAIVAVLIAAVIVVPRLGRNPSIITPATTPPSPSPSPSPSADPYGNWTQYSGRPEHGGYTLRHPQEWNVFPYEGSHEIVPPGHGLTVAGGATMAVTVELLNEEFDDPDKYRPQGFDRSTRVDGRPFIWKEELLARGARKHFYRFDWSECVRGISPSDCTREPRTLVVEIHAGSGSLWDTYGATAERIVGSIEWGGMFVPDPPRTNREMIPSSASS